MIELCIDARMAFFSGIGTCIRQISPFLNQPPFRTTLLVDRKDQAWCKAFEQILFDAPIYSIQEQLLYPLKIPKCDLFWSPHYNIPLFPIKAKKRIVTIHDTYHLALGSPLEKTYAKPVMHQALHRSEGVITVSHFSKAEIEKYVGKKEIQVIPIGVHSEHFKRSVDVQNRVRKTYQLPEKYVLFVSNLKPHKNASGLIRAFSRASLSDHGLVLVGKGEPIEGALTLRNVSNEELPILYSLAQMFVFPSFYEGFGLPPLEAMSCGCPTLVSKAASIPEVCGDASLYFDPHQIEEMAHAICRVAKEEALRAQLVEKGLQRARSFSWEQTGVRYREFFEKIHLRL